MSKPSKTWKFTDFDMSKRAFFENLDANVVVFGEESCPKTGKPHLQGHVSFKRCYRISSLKKLNEKCHWEVAKCEDFNYELKGDNVFIKDNRKKKGQRTDLEEIATMVENGATIREIAKEYPSQYIRYGQGIHRYMGTMVPPRDGTEAPKVSVYFGKTGTGKSKMARELFKGENYYVWTPQRGKWFDGYYGQNNVIFEEFRGQLPLGFLLTLIDRYECPVETKGGMTEFCALNIVFTSPSEPKDWYERLQNEDVLAQLERRITEVIDCNL